ncbi:hypothetical protein M1N79_02505 [Dehalococcoidia bacterium]|nr:hypothetical protein [Dehalococcoidia bacterium]
MWEIELSRQADKFAHKEGMTDDEILLLLQKFINYSKGLDENIDLKKMKGKWKGHHRIRVGKIRMLLRVNFKERAIFIDKIDYRGGAYK